MTTTSETPVDGAAAPRRPLHTRLSTGHLLVVLAAVLAAVANYAVLRAQADTVTVLVATDEVPAGTSAADLPLRTTELRADDDVLATLVTPDRRGELDGMIATTSIGAGTPLRWADLQPRAADGDLRRMSLPVPVEHAVGGDLAVGDRVDVVHVVDGTARFVVSGAEVLAVARRDATALGGLGRFHLTIAVDAEQALCLAEAVDDGRVDVLLATGQEPVEAAGCSRPVEAGPPESGRADTRADAAERSSGTAVGSRP